VLTSSLPENNKLGGGKFGAGFKFVSGSMMR
jgi:hypothetical protein